MRSEQLEVPEFNLRDFYIVNEPMEISWELGVLKKKAKGAKTLHNND